MDSAIVYAAAASLHGAGRHAFGSALLCLVAACTPATPEQLIASAERRLAAHDERAAQIELRNAIRQAPSSARALRLLGQSLLRTGDPRGAEAALRKALDAGEPVENLLPALSRALLQQGEPERLIAEYESLYASLEPRHAAVAAGLQADLGHAWLMRADAARAARAFERALGMVPGHPGARLGNARLAAQAGRIDEAESVVAQVLAAEPELVEAHALRAQIAMARARPADAAAALERILAIEPGNIVARTALASTRIALGEHERAQAALAADPAVAGDARLVYLRGQLALRRGDLQKARDEAAGLLRRSPDQPAGLALAGEIELRADSLALAQTYLERALRVSPELPTPRRLLASTYLKQGQAGRAAEVLQPLLHGAASPDPQLLMLAGEAYLAGGDAAQADELFSRAKADASAEGAARLQLGRLAVQRGDIGRGAGEWQAASALHPQGHEAELMLFALHMRRDEPAQALAVAEALTKKLPQDPLGHVLAGRARLDMRQPAAAREHFAAALALRADYLPALRGLAEADLTDTKPAQAAGRFDALLAKSPGDEQVLAARAEIHERLGETAPAAALLRRAVEANPDSVPAHAALVQHHLRQRDAAAAVVVARQAAAAHPQQARFVELLGDTLQAGAMPADAVRAYRSLVELQPRSLGPLVKLAAGQSRQGDVAGAAATLAQARRLAPDHDGVAADLAGAYVRASRFDEALAVARAVQNRRPRAELGHLLEGDVQAARRQWVDAERAYRAALNLLPSSGEAALRLCRLFDTTGRRPEASRFAKEWLARRPSDLPVRLYAADAALRAGDHRLAARHYEAFLAGSPGHALALNNLAWVLGKLQDPRALEVAERAVARAPDSAVALDTLAMLHLERGDHGTAMGYLARVRALAPERKDLRLHYAVGLLRAGRTDEARSELRALAAAPESFDGKSEIPALLDRL